MSFVRSFFNRISGIKHTRVPHIEGSERVVVDSSVLCCPVCYEVYSAVPLHLSCGHTFCDRCVHTMQAHCMADDEKSVVIQCPLCREPITQDGVQKNYLIDDLLKTCEVIADELPRDKEKHATLRLAKDRSDKRASELEQRNSALSSKLSAVEQRLRMTNASIAAVVVTVMFFELFSKFIDFYF